MTSPLAGLANTINRSFKNIFFDATLTRDGANSGEPCDPDTAAATSYSCKAIVEDYYAGVKGTDFVGATDVKVLILRNSLAVDPEPMDRISVPFYNVSGVVYGGTTGQKAVCSDPAKATWEVRLVT